MNQQNKSFKLSIIDFYLLPIFLIINIVKKSLIKQKKLEPVRVRIIQQEQSKRQQYKIKLLILFLVTKLMGRMKANYLNLLQKKSTETYQSLERRTKLSKTSINIDINNSLLI